MAIKDFYLGDKTDFLVIGYNDAYIDPKKFTQSKNFKMLPYKGTDKQGNLAVVQWRVWPALASQFPEIDFWVVHDYDVICKPTDRSIASHVEPNQYAMLGKPIPLWQPGMPEQDVADSFPFSPGYRFWKKVQMQPQVAADSEIFEGTLRKNFPNFFQGLPTILCGYGDILATYSKNLLLLSDPRLNPINRGGIEQVPHSVFGYFGLTAVDLRSWYSLHVSLDNTLYVSFNNKFDISHPVKYWPVGKQPGLKLKTKRLIKQLLTPSRGVSWPFA